MSSKFFDHLESESSSLGHDTDKIRSFLKLLEDEFDAMKFTNTEWNIIHDKLVKKLIPALRDYIKNKQKDNLIKDCLELFRKHVRFESSIHEEYWSDYLNFAVIAFNSGNANNVRVGSLELFQTLFEKKEQPVALDEIQKQMFQDFVKNGLFRILTSSSRSQPSLVQIVNSTLGHLCRFYQ